MPSSPSQPRSVGQTNLPEVTSQTSSPPSPSRLKHLVPTVGTFFTPLPLPRAFQYQDTRRHISSRRFVAPSFNDIRLVLNTAQLLSIASSLRLITFDGDLTLYPDGTNLLPSNPVIPRILSLLEKGVAVAIVTAAGYTEAGRYRARLFGLLDAVLEAEKGGRLNDPTLLVMGGEANFLFKYSSRSTSRLEGVPGPQWLLPEMALWTQENITALLDVAQSALQSCIHALDLRAQLVRKERAVGIIPEDANDPFTREQLEETVLVVQQILEGSEAGKKVPFCAFNGGNDVFVDIGDKSWGVLACQKYLGGVEGARTLHVGDQFLSGGGNDFKARLACTTAWIASPVETVQLLDELAEHSDIAVAGSYPT